MDPAGHRNGVKQTDAEFAAINIVRGEIQCEWNDNDSPTVALIDVRAPTVST